ncbi:ORF28 [Leucania separata nucleopolyhedrovirus]|uniref:ORF28 n=1 Tax=Leucania separata nucleopolyhedrovirus TaxID=1307956 RepID=Q0IL91_NPVLS|nr:ORF28 [Leucania separata nucleopolyhedrovirus]AAR28792.1 ORF28 [Leucania separata nucleopolyhedrovirus]
MRTGSNHSTLYINVFSLSAGSNLRSVQVEKSTIKKCAQYSRVCVSEALSFITPWNVLQCPPTLFTLAPIELTFKWSSICIAHSPRFGLKRCGLDSMSECS